MTLSFCLWPSSTPSSQKRGKRHSESARKSHKSRGVAQIEPRTISRDKSVIFYVDPTKEKFIIPIKILRRSPFYASNYQVFTANIETKLPRIDPNDFRNLENYLYDSDFDESLYDHDSRSLWKGLRNMYLLGADWELAGLQKLVVKKFKRLHNLLANSPEMPSRLLETAERIYRLVPESDHRFRHYFVKTLRGLYQDRAEFPQEMERKLVMDGGLLAGDYLEARIAAFDDITTQLALYEKTPPTLAEPVHELRQESSHGRHHHHNHRVRSYHRQRDSHTERHEKPPQSHSALLVIDEESNIPTTLGAKERC